MSKLGSPKARSARQDRRRVEKLSTLSKTDANRALRATQTELLRVRFEAREWMGRALRAEQALAEVLSQEEE